MSAMTEAMDNPNAASAPERRRAVLKDYFDRNAKDRLSWIKKNSYFYDEDQRYMRFLIPEGARVLELGCGIGELLAALKPAQGVGVDFSAPMVEVARQRHSSLEFCVGDIEDPNFIQTLNGPFDFIIMSDTIGSLEDCETTFSNLHRLCDRETRLVVSYYSHLWEPVLALGARLGLRMPPVDQNFLPPADIQNILELANFEVVRREWRQIMPRRLFGLGSLINKYIGTLPLIRGLCLRHYLVARPLLHRELSVRSATVVVPCRNERGNIEAAVTRTPRFCDDLEILFVEGHSKDGTLDEIKRVISAYPDKDIKVIVQDGKGKADAVFKAFAHARGDVLMILDADLTMPPEQLPKFWNAISRGQGEFINGSRLVYPMEKEAMRFLNLVANRIFSILFTWLLNQRFTDTLCGTKVIMRRDFERLWRNRGYFGNFDPFGDFELIFGASKLNLKVVEIPVRYASRVYGETQISRFSHGLLLLRMVVFAYRKFKAF
jgi:SAM-dependent methyltransferase